jgi:hypothetical protein
MNRPQEEVPLVMNELSSFKSNDNWHGLHTQLGVERYNGRLILTVFFFLLAIFGIVLLLFFSLEGAVSEKTDDKLADHTRVSISFPEGIDNTFRK